MWGWFMVVLYNINGMELIAVRSAIVKLVVIQLYGKMEQKSFNAIPKRQ